MKTLGIDIETYSSHDLIKGGVYKYVEAPDFTVLLLAYQYDSEPVQLCDLTEYAFPYHVLQHLTNKNIIKTAWNANFERTTLAKHLGITLDPAQWRCTMAHAAQLGLPLNLGKCAEVLNVDQKKDTEGKALIKYFSVPCKPTKVNGGRTRNLPQHDPEKWERFKEYCKQDVRTEQAIKDKISFFQIPETEIKLWNLDQKINDTGVLLDTDFAKRAIEMDNTQRAKLTAEAIDLTGLANPNSVAQLKDWIESDSLLTVNTLNKEAIPVLMEETNCDTIKRVLSIRQEMSKTSVKKYTAMMSAVCEDSRVRGLLQYYGANRTGRWAGRLVQVQNLPQNKIPDLDLARNLVRAGDLELVDMLYGNVPDTLSQLIRTAFVAPAGNRFIVTDLSAIEARIIAWLSGERWRLDVFNTHGKIYEASAAQMFRIPIEKVTKEIRAKGKIGELALGFGGGPPALIAMGALKMGLQEEELPKLVKMWRNANKNIVNWWRVIEDAAVSAVQDGTHDQLQHGLRMFVEKNVFFIQLPSGRKLSYQKPTLVPNQFGGLSLRYEGMNQTSKQWQKIDTYGGKLVENIVQAVARDVLAEKMLHIHTAGYKIVMDVHDEIVNEMPYGKGSCEEINKIMGEPIKWAKGLPLKAESYETEYYKKD
jgi:DNA polymerase